MIGTTVCSELGASRMGGAETTNLFSRTAEQLRRTQTQQSPHVFFTLFTPCLYHFFTHDSTTARRIRL
jgi:hypothetical protein